MKNVTQVLIALFIGIMGFASKSSAQFRSGEALKTELKDSHFTATVPVGFHFNEKAPNAIIIDDKKVKPTRVEARKVEFVGLTSGWKKAFANLYICDDALTYCEPRRVDLAGPLGSKNAAEPAKSLSAKPKKTTAMKLDSNGFILDDLSGAVEKAKREKKLLLVDFSARWCPGCMRLESEIFSNADFKKQASQFVKVKIDVDRFENAVLSEKYRIQGIPAVLALDAEQKEIERFVDFQPMPMIKDFLGSVRQNSVAIEKLLGKGGAATAAENEQIGRRLLRAGDAALSLTYFQKVAPAPIELLTAQVAAAKEAFTKDDKTKKSYERVLREAIDADPASTRALLWRTQLIALNPEAADIKTLTSDGVRQADQLLENREKIPSATRGDLVGEFTGYEPLMIAIARADLISANGAESAEAKQAWKKAAEVGRGLNIKMKARGPAVRYLIVLTQAEEFAEAAELSKKLLKADPSNPELLRRQLRSLNGTGDYAKAIVVGQRALKQSYGRNEYWVAEQLAKSYLGAGKKKEANELLDRYLNRDDADWASLKSTLESMRKLRS
jgi:thioredoxin-like negative regulator of GroEL